MEYNLDNSIGYNLSITALMIRGEFYKRIADFGIAPEQYGILYFIDSHPGMTQSEIAQAIYKNKTTITRSTDALVKKGLLTKEWSREDRRRQNIKITEDGLRVLEAAKPIADRLNDELHNSITVSEAQMLLSILKKVQSIFSGSERFCDDDC